MKHAKKLAGVLLAMVMVLSLAAVAFAAGSNDGSITIRNATKEKTYTIYKVFDLTYSGDNVAYSYTKTGESDALYTALTATNSPFTLTKTPTTDNTYSVSVKENKSDAEVISWMTTNHGLFTRTAQTKATDSTLTFTGLAYGYYYIESELGTIVTVDSAKPNVEVVDKNTEPTWDNPKDDNPEVKLGKVIVSADGTKTVESSANYGDTVKFNIAINATAYKGDQLATYYYITDTLGDGFDAATNIKVLIDGVEKTLDTDYTLKQDGKTFNITIPFGEKYGSSAKIEVTYSAVVNNSAVLAGEGNKNSANFTYDLASKGTPTNPTDPEYPDPKDNPTYEETNKKTTTTYVYALGIKKVDPKGNVLTGAEFTITDKDGTPIRATGTDGAYEYSATGDVTQFKTDTNGILLIKGLAAGEYKVQEVVAPAGFNLLKDPVTVKAEIAQTQNYTTTITVYKDGDGNVTNTVTDSKTETTVNANVVPLVVVNQSGTELPSTGGMGTTLFFALGGILVAGAAVLLVVKKRMGNTAE